MSILEYFNSLEHTHSSLYNELNQELPKLNPESFFDYKKNLTDPFQAITTNPDTDNSILNHLYDWYKSINPYYELLDTLNPQIIKFKEIQPYRTLLLNMAKDLIRLQYTKKFPEPNIPQMTNNNKDKHNNNHLAKYNKNNKSRAADFYYGNTNNVMKTQFVNGTKLSQTINTLPSDNFDEIESIINSILILLNDILTIDNPLHYKYLSIIDIIDKYLQLFSFGKEIKGKFKTQLFKYTETAFIIYPTFNPISYTKVIYFMQAPVINFMMMNTRKVVHSTYEFPYHQIYHDLINHANKTHQIYKVKEKTTDLDTISTDLEDRFSKHNITINVLKKYINYNIKSFFVHQDLPNTDDNIKKFILCYALFITSHELGNNDFSSISQIIIEIQKGVKNKFLWLHDINESLPPSKYNMNSVIQSIKEHNIAEIAISQLKDNKVIINSEIKSYDEAMEEKYSTQTKKPTNLSPPNHLKNVNPYKLKYFKNLGISQTHKGGKKPNTHHKQTKKKSNRKTTNKSHITNLLKKHILSKVNQKIK